MHDTSPERCVPGAVPGDVSGVGFMFINAELCLQSQSENCIVCTTEYSKILPLIAI